MSKERRSQESRSSVTKTQILDAAIEVLFTQGFSGATMQNIAAGAKVSRGAMLHHFSSKTALLVAVLLHAHETDVKQLRSGLAEITSPLDRLRSLSLLSWQVLSGPSGIAALEIMLGSRSDQELGKALEPVQTQIESESRERVREMIEAAGFDVTRENTDLVELAVAAIRGLSIEKMFRRNATKPPPALETLQAIIEARLMRPHLQ